MDTNDISACEKLVMKIIWNSTEGLVLQEVINRANEENGKGWKPQTVATFLARLVKKGYLRAEKKGRGSIYTATVSKDEFLRATLEENAKFFTKGDMAELACSLCDELLSKEEIDRLRKKLDGHN